MSVFEREGVREDLSHPSTEETQKEVKKFRFVLRHLCRFEFACVCDEREREKESECVCVCVNNRM